MHNEDVANEFAQLIAYYRQKRGMSQGQLAQATRLSRTYIYHLENGQRLNPSTHVVQNIARVLSLRAEERNSLYDAYTTLTGHLIDHEAIENELLDLGSLADLLVHNTSYPAHSLDRLWYLHSWNEAAICLFEAQEEVARQQNGQKIHLLELVFEPHLRRRFQGWENLAHRLVSDFQYNTQTITHLPEYKTLLKRLKELPDYRRISATAYSSGKPAPSFVFQIQHSTLQKVTLRTATTVFTGINSYSMVSYVPGDQRTLEIYRKQGWQP